SKVSSGLVSKLKIKNSQATPVGFKFKTNAPLRYSVKPVLGVLVPGQSIEVFVRCESWVNPQDRFLLQSVALTEEESQQIDAASWRALERNRIIESFIQCSSSSTLAMREPQDDGGSISSSSAKSNSTRSSQKSSQSSLAKSLTQQQQQQQQHQQQQRHSSIIKTRKMSTSSINSTSTSNSISTSTSAAPGSYPAQFSATTTSQSKKHVKNDNTNVPNVPSTKDESTSSTHAPLALFAAPVHYLHTKASNSRQTVRTLTRFLAVRQYTKMQVFTVSMICLLLGLLLPMEKLVYMLGTGGGGGGVGSAGPRQQGRHLQSNRPIGAVFASAHDASTATAAIFSAHKPMAIVVPMSTQQPLVQDSLQRPSKESLTESNEAVVGAL
ncbi:phosphatidylinositol-binding protein scs2, partial [Podila epigama]